MAITIAAKYPFDIPAQANALKIPTNALKIIIQKLFNMSAWVLIPDQINFIEISKAYGNVTDPNDPDVQYVPNREGPLLINGVDTLIIGVREGQGTDTASTLAYICKAAKTVYNLDPWKNQMDARLK